MNAPEMSQKTLAMLETKSVRQNSDYSRKCFNVNDFQILAQQLLPKDLYEYLASGSDDEVTLNENRRAFQRWFLRPRVMRPVGKISTRTTLFGNYVSMPVFVSPAGVHAICDPEGECTTVQACAKAGILFGLSQHSTRSIEEVAAAAPPSTLRFYQLYILKDRERTKSLIRRALKAGYSGLILTVDSVRFGYREADARNGFNALPSPHRLKNYDDSNHDTQSLDKTYNSQEEKAWDQNSEQMFEQNVSWNDIRWIKKEAGLVPLVIKGIMTPEDAELAIAAGADGIMVSNHGGRQLDGCLATIDALPPIAKVVAGRVPIWLDSGIRRGTDVLKALALGASAVGIGKPVFFGLAVGGQDAVSYLLKLLQTEIEAAMAICGIEKISDITPNLVTPQQMQLASASHFRSSL
ncbi:MAG: hypothetical protein SGBAC_012131 [Bacillariaceae sp.]